MGILNQGDPFFICLKTESVQARQGETAFVKRRAKHREISCDQSGILWNLNKSPGAESAASNTSCRYFPW